MGREMLKIESLIVLSEWEFLNLTPKISFVYCIIGEICKDRKLLFDQIDKAIAYLWCTSLYAWKCEQDKWRNINVTAVWGCRQKAKLALKRTLHFQPPKLTITNWA
jgi:hypothetical protein